MKQAKQNAPEPSRMRLCNYTMMRLLGAQSGGLFAHNFAKDGR